MINRSFDNLQELKTAGFPCSYACVTVSEDLRNVAGGSVVIFVLDIALIVCGILKLWVGKRFGVRDEVRS